MCKYEVSIYYLYQGQHILISVFPHGSSLISWYLDWFSLAAPVSFHSLIVHIKLLLFISWSPPASSLHLYWTAVCPSESIRISWWCMDHCPYMEIWKNASLHQRVSVFKDNNNSPLNHEGLLMGNWCVFRMLLYSSCLVLHWVGYNGNITCEALLPVSHINLKPSGTTVEKFNLDR